MQLYMEKSQASSILDTLKTLYPDAKCELDHESAFELLVAVTLSAQTTDKRVNVVTKELFKKYESPEKLASADYDTVYEMIKSLGLAKTKTKNIIEMSKMISSLYKGKVPSTREELCTLPGVGRKTANVVLSVWFNTPALAVDTHVARVSKRLGLTLNTDPLKIEEDLTKLYNEDDWYNLHHCLIFFGRYKCKAQNPDCEDCPFVKICKK